MCVWDCDLGERRCLRLFSSQFDFGSILYDLKSRKHFGRGSKRGMNLGQRRGSDRGMSRRDSIAVLSGVSKTVTVGSHLVFFLHFPCHTEKRIVQLVRASCGSNYTRDLVWILSGGTTFSNFFDFFGFSLRGAIVL